MIVIRLISHQGLEVDKSPGVSPIFFQIAVEEFQLRLF